LNHLKKRGNTETVLHRNDGGVLLCHSITVRRTMAAFPKNAAARKRAAATRTFEESRHEEK
jgi:hypothetical protein